MKFEEKVSMITQKKLKKSRASSRLLKNVLVRSTKTGVAANVPKAVLAYLKASSGDNLYFTLSKTGIRVSTKVPRTPASASVNNFISHKRKIK